MRILKVIIVLSLVLHGCKSNLVCKSNKDYFVKVNESKPYNVKSEYCIHKSEQSQEGKSTIKLNLFDRINQKVITEAVIWLNNKEKVNYSITNNEIAIEEGDYDIDVVTPNNLPLKIKGLSVSQNQIIEINGYLGNSLQF